VNGLNRKLHELENNVLDFPPDDKGIVLGIFDNDEMLLHDYAKRIRKSLKDEAQAIIDSGGSVEQQNEAAKQLIGRLSGEERAILEQSTEFISYRVKRLINKWFAAAYPHGEDERVMLRVMWFFREMQKFLHANLIEDYEWNSNRNEDDPNFDDYAWWDAVEAKVKAEYPEGRFSEKSFEEFERLHDEFVARKIREYYEGYPQEREALMHGLNKKSEELKKNE
jgi:hypothetical protein